MEPELGTNLIERLNGPFSLRLLLQPTMALLFAMRDGHKDAKAAATPYLQALISQQTDGRRETLSSAWASLSKVMTIAFILDCAFQYATTGSIALLEAIAMALLLCAGSRPYEYGTTGSFVRQLEPSFVLRRRSAFSQLIGLEAGRIVAPVEVS